MAKGLYPVKVIAIVPGGGVLADAVGAELAKRGFTVFSAAATQDMVTGVDFRLVTEAVVPGRGNPSAVDNFKSQLASRGIDAFLVVRAEDFTPRERPDHPYWQSATSHLRSTNFDLPGYPSPAWRWINRDKSRAKTASEAAAEVVTGMARRSSP